MNTQNDCIMFTSDKPFRVTLSRFRDFLADYPMPNIEYSYDQNTWYKLQLPEFSVENGKKVKTKAEEIVPSENNVLYIRGKGNAGIYSTFVFLNEENRQDNSLRISCKGNIMTLLDYQAPGKAKMGKFAFANLFNDCPIISAPDLPAKTLAEYCYQGLFIKSSIEVAPDLPAHTVKKKAYDMMFFGCQSLKKAPKILATSIEEFGCNGMFSTSAIETAPELYAEDIGPYAYHQMFAFCKNLKTAQSCLPARKLAKGCYRQMYTFSGIAKAPDLPAAELAEECYWEMFFDCRNLMHLPSLSAKVMEEQKVVGTTQKEKNCCVRNADVNFNLFGHFETLKDRDDALEAIIDEFDVEITNLSLYEDTYDFSLKGKCAAHVQEIFIQGEQDWKDRRGLDEWCAGWEDSFICITSNDQQLSIASDGTWKLEDLF